ncbi:alpha/beta fold hydrolase [Piscinibacter koreensis]|uniref:Alpha/beta fold hydrolase n=1 Tax=Piscinibacter koreensis TaxID=2742824 RepID=A0A7Y6TXQ3_9BURK|nr:alpha/beta hydrolase [Schlegelella koreensis]NUZ07295.1 alpha/beta fold hydrolase [Schlegelella koreensis]
MSDIETRKIAGPDGAIAVRIQGDAGAPAVVMAHSILSSSMMWDAQAELLASRGFRVVRIDTRGHGESEAKSNRCTMDDLGADTLAVFDALGLERAHYVGLSLGAMSGFGLGIDHADRLLSLVLCDGRADAPPAVAAPWDERIEQARRSGSCGVLADPTIERWFGKAFVESHPEVAERFRAAAGRVSLDGFEACARAIQGLDYLDRVDRIRVPTTMIVGANDGVLPQAMEELRGRIEGSVLELIPNAGHLPNIDAPEAFDAALLRHFERVGSDATSTDS